MSAGIHPEAILRRYDETWLQLEEVIRSLTDAELSLPGREGEWSGKDILAHIARWQSVACEVVEARAVGREPAELYADYDTWNDRWVVEDRTLSTGEIRDRLAAAGRRLRELAGSLPGARWDDLVQEWVEQTGVEHVEEHLASLRAPISS